MLGIQGRGNKMYPNRTLCDVLEEMRKCCQMLNFSYLPSLIEEAQHMGNRMEAALVDKKDIKTLVEKREALRDQVKNLREKIKEAGEKPVEDNIWG